MAHNTIVFRQLLDFLPRHEFDAEAQQHQEGQRLRVMSRWAQFVALGWDNWAACRACATSSATCAPNPTVCRNMRKSGRNYLSDVRQPMTLLIPAFGHLLTLSRTIAVRASLHPCSRKYSASRS